MKLHLRDRNPAVVSAWALAFKDTQVTVSTGDIFDAFPASAAVSPANSHGYMDGGIDLAYARRWPDIEARVQEQIRHEIGGLPIGRATHVLTGEEKCPWLLVAPTMTTPGPVPNTANAYLALLAALCRARDVGLRSIVCPGLCTWSGRMHPDIAAWQMRAAWERFTGHEAV